MSFNGSGSFVINSSGQPVVANTLIQATVFNALTADLATGLSTCITKDGQTTVTANIPMGGYRFTGLGAGAANGQSLRYEQLFSTSAVTLLGAMNWVKGADIASAATINLTTATGNGVHITGTTQIDAVTLGSGMWRLVIFDGALTLAHHATNNNLPGGANITTAANDRALYWSDGTTVYCVSYQRASGFFGIPSGIITMWSGSIVTIPSGWALCDGTAGTPDLRDRFIVGAGSTYAVNATGGSADAVVVAHDHAITDPGHLHTVGVSSQASVTAGGSNAAQVSGSINSGSNTTGITVDSEGVSGTNANLPPYYALAYIMKT